MNANDSILLRHVLDAITKVEFYLRGVDESLFRQDTLTQDAVIRQMEVIGALVERVSPEVRGRFPGVPWSQFIATREAFLREVIEVDAAALWRAATEVLPGAKEGVTYIVAEMAWDRRRRGGT
jgi:uncharacterized protein with HEPN domain